MGGGGKNLGGINLKTDEPKFLQKVNIYKNHLNWSIFNGGKNFGGTNLEG